MKKKLPLILTLVFVLLLGGAYVLYNHLSADMAPNQLATPQAQETRPSETADSTDSSAETTQETEPPKSMAPDFTAYDKEGNPVKLSDFRGKPVVLNFWSSNCGPCRAEMPDFQRVYEEMGEDVQFLMVNMTDGSWDTVESATAFISEQGFTFPVYFDTQLSAARAYVVNSLPTTYFIDKEGYLTAYTRGMTQESVLRQGIRMITE